jgi:hypothetical protein
LTVVALVILYDQVFIAPTAQPILIFLVIFLFGSIRFLRGDDKPGQQTPFARIVMKLLGIEMPESYEDNEGGTTPSSPDTHRPRASRPSAGSHSSSQKSSKG